MTDQTPPQPDSSEANSSDTNSSDTNLEMSGPSLPNFRPLPRTEIEPGQPELIDDEPSPFISDRIKSGHLGKSEVPKDMWIWAAVAIGLLAIAIFGLSQRPSNAPPEVQIVEPQSE